MHSRSDSEVQLSNALAHNRQLEQKCKLLEQQLNLLQRLADVQAALAANKKQLEELLV